MQCPLAVGRAPAVASTASWEHAADLPTWQLHRVLAAPIRGVRTPTCRVTVEGPLGPAGRPIARLAVVRELSIMGMGNPLQVGTPARPGPARLRSWLFLRSSKACSWCGGGSLPRRLSAPLLCRPS